MRAGGSKYEPSDPAHQLAVSFHTYNFSGCNGRSCWNSTIAPLAGKVPVVTGELGESGCTDTYIDQYMPWADAHGISYLGWTWNSTGPPSNWSCSARAGADHELRRHPDGVRERPEGTPGFTRAGPPLTLK